MKVLKKVVLIIGIIIGLVLVVSLFLPSKFKVERTAVVKAPADTVFTWVANLKNWVYWSPWQKAEPDMKITYSTSTYGPGAEQKWESEKSGNGALKIVSSNPPKELGYEFVMRSDMKSDGKFTLTPEGDATKVTWTMSGDVGMNPLAKYFVMMMDGMVGPDFEQGLKNMQEMAAKK